MNISGHVDLCGPDLIEGWLYCDVWDDTSIKLQVYVGDALLGECIVDRFRADLQQAGFGDGRCGFSFPVPTELGPFDFTRTRLRFVGSPVYLLPDDHTAFTPTPGLVDEAPAGLHGGGSSAVDMASDVSAGTPGRVRWGVTRSSSVR
jgi:hypothetical protein